MKSRRIIECTVVGLVLLIASFLVYKYIKNRPIEETGGYNYYILDSLYEREKIQLFDTYHSSEGKLSDLNPDNYSFKIEEESYQNEEDNNSSIINEEYTDQSNSSINDNNLDNQSYPIIIVDDIEKYNNAYNKFISLFVSQELLDAKLQGKEIEKPQEEGEIDIDYQVKSSYEVVGTNELPTDEYILLETEDKIFNYLCYDIDTEMQYYETKEGDTLETIKYYFGGLTNEQLNAMNKDITLNENQPIPSGTKLNVTYFRSPLSVIVTKYRLVQEVIIPDSTLYIDDPSLPSGTKLVETIEENGIRKVLYEEKYTNGILFQSMEISSEIIKSPVQGVVHIGA